MNAMADTFDDIDKTITEKLEQLRKIERVPVGLKARVMRHYDHIRYANKILGWSYFRITNDVLRPAGMLISPHTLRIYMEELAKQQDGKKTKAKRNAQPMPDRDISPTVPDEDSAAMVRDNSDAVTLPNEIDNATGRDKKNELTTNMNAKDEHAGMRRARSRT